jgi:hypothetical protein
MSDWCACGGLFNVTASVHTEDKWWVQVLCQSCGRTSYLDDSWEEVPVQSWQG